MNAPRPQTSLTHSTPHEQRVSRSRRQRLFIRALPLVLVALVAAAWLAVPAIGRAMAGRMLADSGPNIIVPAPPQVLSPHLLYGDLDAPMRAVIGDRVIDLPVLDTDIDVDIQGTVAEVTIRQTFENPADVPVNAHYAFPLPGDAAVHAVVMEIGDERIRAVIDRIEEATETFEAAQEAGQAASLVTQQRPNVFTQQIANLMPGLPISVELRYVQTVPRLDGEYELVVPLVVGPRYTPTGTGTPAGSPAEAYDGAGLPVLDSDAEFEAWELERMPVQNPVLGVDTAEPSDLARVAIDVRLHGGFTIHRARSTTHPLFEDWNGETDVALRLAQERVPDDRDFVLRYGFAGDDVAAGVLSSYDDRGGFLSLRVEPPRAVAEADAIAREMVFVLDTSGSMNGLPIQASRGFAAEALRNLRPTDTFRIIRFGDEATEFSSTPMPVTPDTIAAGVRYLEGLEGMGGTRMETGFRQAFAPPVPADTVRLVVLLTDGYIGDDWQIVQLVDQERGDARIFSVGVGAAVNRFLLDELARRGRGFSRTMTLSEDVNTFVWELVERLQTPVLTDVWIDWAELEVTGAYPAELPDLFAGQSVQATARYAEPGTYEVEVHGRLAGRHWSETIEVELAGPDDPASEALPIVWARAAIDDAMTRMTLSRYRSNVDVDAVKEEVVALGLDFSIVTQWTSFVAVSERIVNDDPDAAEEVGVPVPMVDGTTTAAYGGGSFGGTSTPEPTTWLALLLAGATSSLGLRRRRTRR